MNNTFLKEAKTLALTLKCYQPPRLCSVRNTIVPPHFTLFQNVYSLLTTTHISQRNPEGYLGLWIREKNYSPAGSKGKVSPSTPNTPSFWSLLGQVLLRGPCGFCPSISDMTLSM